MYERFESQRRAFEKDPYPSGETRLSRLERLLKLTEMHETEICAAINDDFGCRPSQETRLAEILVVRAGIRFARAELAKWMRERRVPTSLHFLPGRNRLLAQPLGVVGVVSPWNYPFQLAIAPVTAALAAGNRALIKPSELTPKFSALLQQLVASYFDADELSVITGGSDTGKAFVALPFDHLFFTGSTVVGREVAKAAAANLTPVTLELGGKSPAILDASCEMDSALSSIAYAKLLNAGQTCIAPDYLLVPKGQAQEVADGLLTVMAQLYPKHHLNKDYTSIINERHFERLRSMVLEARGAGTEIRTLGEADGRTHPGDRKFSPTLAINPADDLRLMQEEIFGPVLPIVEYDGIDEAIARINRGNRPLALYWFGRDGAKQKRMLRETLAGGVTINDCLWHLAQERQPFGGVGSSGMGAYHGEWGFRTFSKEKPVFIQSRLNATALLRPPYGKTFELLLGMLKRVT